MNIYYALSKNLTEASSYKLVRCSDREIVFSNGSISGWLFFLIGSAVLAMLSCSGNVSHLLSGSHSVAYTLLICLSMLFVVLGLLAGIGCSKLSFDLTTGTYRRRDISLKGTTTTGGPTRDFFASGELATLSLRGREHDLYIARLGSDKFGEIIIAVTKSRRKIDDLLEVLRCRLNISVMETDKRSTHNPAGQAERSKR